MNETSSTPLKLCLLLSGIVVATRLLAGPWIIDDAYITFRYARNAGDGLGLVFNRGQHVLGTSSPLFTLILSLVYKVGHWEIPWIALGINSLADGCSIFLLYKMAQRLNAPSWAVFLYALRWAFYPLHTIYLKWYGDIIGPQLDLGGIRSIRLSFLIFNC